MLWKQNVKTSQMKLTDMNSHEILRADALDILFENRNKLYGAYTLRKYYNHRLTTALGCALGFVLLLLLLLPKHVAERISKAGQGQVVVLQTYEIPPLPPELPKPPVSAPQTTARQEFNNLVVVDDAKAPQDVPDQSALERSVISNITVESEVVNTGIVPESELVITKPTINEVKPHAGTALLQREPEFPGGSKAWIDFLNRNLMVPDELEAGEQKTVLIRFQVAVDGSVTGFEVIRSGGRQYDHEVIRVLKRMPKWKPAIQNGEAVVRSFTQPVIFMGVE